MKFIKKEVTEGGKIFVTVEYTKYLFIKRTVKYRVIEWDGNRQWIDSTEGTMPLSDELAALDELLK